jgi:6-phosphogluconolactonase (cycloisomerase 2 family)
VSSGATYAPITVTNITTGLTVYSSAPFTVTFPGGGDITTSSFASKIDSTTGSYPYAIAISDIDGDGKPDVAVTNVNSTNISVFRNTSTSGSISLAGKVDYATGSTPAGITIADIDGDGKPDVVGTNEGSNTMSIFLNTSTSGNISLAGKADYATGNNPAGIATADIDGDGKPDVVATNYGSNTISVFRNTSTIGNVSFEGKIDSTTGSVPNSIAITDIDGDGKPDMAATNWNSNTISVFRNTSTNGNISLAGKIDYATGNNPAGIAIADIDGDGKPDLVAANYGSNTISLLRNTGIFTGVANDESAIPTQFELMQNYPNPFNPTTTIKYQIPGTGTQYIVSLQIFDLLGREVATLVNANKPADYYQVEWHANVASGVYFYRLEAVSISDPSNRFVDTKKMLLMK